MIIFTGSYFRNVIFAIVIVYGAADIAISGIVVKPYEIDFGRFYKKDHTDTRIVEIINTGNTDVTIKSMNAGCVRVNFIDDTNIIHPGGVGHIQLTLDGEHAQIGDNKYDLSITTSEQSEIIAGVVKYAFDSDLRIIPDRFHIVSNRSINNNISPRATVRIFDNLNWLLSIEKITASNPMIKYTIRDLKYTSTCGQELHSIAITVFIPSDWPIGRINEKLTILTNHPEIKEFELPIVGDIIGPVNILPDLILLSKLTPGSLVDREVVLTADTEIDIGKIVYSSKTMKISTNRFDDGKKIVLSIYDSIPTDFQLDKGNYEVNINIEILKPLMYTTTVRLLGIPTIVRAKDGKHTENSTTQPCKGPS